MISVGVIQNIVICYRNLYGVSWNVETQKYFLSVFSCLFDQLVVNLMNFLSQLSRNPVIQQESPQLTDNYFKCKDNEIIMNNFSALFQRLNLFKTLPDCNFLTKTDSQFLYLITRIEHYNIIIRFSLTFKTCHLSYQFLDIPFFPK